MIRLKADYGLKLPGDVQYSSRCASASIEVELDDISPQAAKDKLASLWAMLKESVEAELNGASSYSDNGNGYGRSNGNGYSRTNNNRSNMPATKKQIGYLLSLARKGLGYSPSEAGEWIQRQFHTSLDSMNKHEAGKIIEYLKANQAA